MANFTDEAKVRAKFELHDTVLVSSELIDGAIDDAHTEILRYLAPDVEINPPEEGLVLGETLLAGAHVFRTLAAKDAFDQKHLTIGGQDVAGGQRFNALERVGTVAEELAWYILEPYLEHPGMRAVGDATDTEPVLGKE